MFVFVVMSMAESAKWDVVVVVGDRGGILEEEDMVAMRM